MDTHRTIWMSLFAATLGLAAALGIFVFGRSSRGLDWYRPAMLASIVLVGAALFCVTAAVRHWPVPLLRHDPKLLYTELIKHHATIRALEVDPAAQNDDVKAEAGELRELFETHAPEFLDGLRQGVVRGQGQPPNAAASYVRQALDTIMSKLRTGTA
jgi:hypothetical protein